MLIQERARHPMPEPADPSNSNDGAFCATPVPESLRLLAQRGERRRYRKGTVLIHEGDRGDTLFIILSGRLRAYSTGEKDREIHFGTYGAGEYIGEMSLDGGLRSASVITLEATECAVVTRHTLQQHIAEHPEFAFELIAKVIWRARAATLTAKQLALNDVYGRLSQLLNSLAVPQNDGSRVITSRPTHQAIASQLGCSREMVSRLLKELSGTYIQIESKVIRIVKTLPMRYAP
jgi:CRP/FNR family transcriptional regulator, cyclic AMP receptor protein